MYTLLGFCIQLAGFYVLYSTSARAVFARLNLNIWLYDHRYLSKITGSLMILVSLIILMMELGMGVGFFFALISFMTISGFTIILLPLKKPKTHR
jgi:hypothetical protein